jgi:hypothetical protein
MITKSAFKELSMEHSNGNYFLRPDRILGCFEVNHNSRPKLNLKSITELEIEKNREKALLSKLEMSERIQLINATRINNAVSVTLWSSLSEVKVPKRTSAAVATSPHLSISASANNNKASLLSKSNMASFSPPLSSVQQQQQQQQRIHTKKDTSGGGGGGGGGGGDSKENDMEIELTELGVNGTTCGDTTGVEHKMHDDDDDNDDDVVGQINPMATLMHSASTRSLGVSISFISDIDEGDDELIEDGTLM